MTSLDIDALALEVHQTAMDHGFWPSKGRNLGEMLMLAVSELSEALEEDRSGRPIVWFLHGLDCVLAQTQDVQVMQHSRKGENGCTCTPKPEGAMVEIIDCIIRCLDTSQEMASREACGKQRRYSVYEVMRLKMDYNNNRAYKHGKGY